MNVLLTEYVWRRIHPEVRGAVLKVLRKSAVIGRRADEVIDDLRALGEHEAAGSLRNDLEYILLFKEKFGVWPPPVIVVVFPD